MVVSQKWSGEKFVVQISLRLFGITLKRFCLSLSFAWARLNAAEDDELAIAGEEDLMARIAKLLGRLHRLPLMNIASGKTALADKFYVCMFALFLEGSMTLDNFATLVSEIVIGSFDMGTELGLARVMPVPVLDLFPWLEGTPMHMQNNRRSMECIYY